MYLHLLLVENQDLDRTKIAKLVEELNGSSNEPRWRLTTRSTTEKAIQHLEAPPPGAMPQVALVDLSLDSAEDGMSLISQMAARYPEIAVLVWSQSASASVWRECVSQGAAGFISKNQTLSAWELERHVLFALSNKRQIREHQKRLETLRESFEKNAIGVAHEVSRYIKGARSRLAEVSLNDGSHASVLLGQVDSELSIVFSMMGQYYRDYEEARDHKHPVRTQMELGSLIKQIINDNNEYWMRRYGKKGLRLTCASNQIGDGDAWVSADRVKLQCILENLIENAVRHQESEDPLVEIRYGLRRQGELVWGEISVRDYGDGFPDEIPEGPLRLANSKFLPSSKGWGVGLYFSSVMAAQHQVGTFSGEIIVENVGDPRGALVSVRIPFGGIEPEDAD